MPVPAATFGQTNLNTAASATAYKSQIDSNSVATTRLADAFAPHQGSTPSMNVYLDPGFILSGTLLTEIGTYTTATFTNTSTSATVANPSGISGTMWISGAGIAAGTTCTISGSTLTLSVATTAAGTNVPVVIGQIATTETAPVSNSRIDRIVVNSSTGVASVITGTPGSSPAVPSLTAGVIPVAQVLLTSTSTVITNSMITDERAVGGGAGANDTEATVASASTTDLGATNVNAILISGTTTITSFGSNGVLTRPFYDVRFSGALTLTYNATSMVLPGKVNITTIAGDHARFQYTGSGNWVCVFYSRASGAPVIEGPTATIASATTTDLGTSGVTTLIVSGTTTITSLGSTATTDNPIYFLTFSGALTLTYNATSLIVPGQANIATAANDTAIAIYLGSGNWQIVSYTKVAGAAAASCKINVQTSTYAPAATDLGNIVSFAGAGANATWTMTAAATLGNGFYCYLSNPTAFTITLQSSGGAIDGYAAGTGYKMYPGEERLIQCTGSAFNTIVLKGFWINTTTTFTFSVPPGYQGYDCEIWGGGGGGGSAATSAGGGGGGGYNRAIITAASMGSTTQTCTVGAGGGVATAGGQTSIGSLLNAYGGGHAVSTSNDAAGGGGSYVAVGGNGVTTTGGTGSGNTKVVLAGLLGTAGLDGWFGGGGASSAANGGSSIGGWGGGGGGQGAGAGGGSIYGGGGGAGSGNGQLGGTSVYGGAGGVGAGANGGNGVAPAGGGAGGTTTGGSGGSGQIWIRGIE